MLDRPIGGSEEVNATPDTMLDVVGLCKGKAFLTH